MQVQDPPILLSLSLALIRAHRDARARAVGMYRSIGRSLYHARNKYMADRTIMEVWRELPNFSYRRQGSPWSSENECDEVPRARVRLSMHQVGRWHTYLAVGRSRRKRKQRWARDLECFLVFVKPEQSKMKRRRGCLWKQKKCWWFHRSTPDKNVSGHKPERLLGKIKILS